MSLSSWSMNPKWLAPAMHLQMEQAERGLAVTSNQLRGNGSGQQKRLHCANKKASCLTNLLGLGDGRSAAAAPRGQKTLTSQCHMAIWSANTPAASWSTKLADKATAPGIAAGGQLLQVLAT